MSATLTTPPMTQAETIEAGAGMTDDVYLAGILFRLWCQTASYPGGHPSRQSALMREHGPQGG